MNTLGTFYNNKVFVIPPQQRPYSWKTLHVKAFLDDFRIAINRGEEHYCGPVFLDRTRDENGQALYEFTTPAGVNLTRHDVLDGQQRITTIMLIAAALAKDQQIVDAVAAGNGPASSVQSELKHLYSYAMGPEGPEGEEPSPDTSRLVYNDADMELTMNHLLFGNPPNLTHGQIVKSAQTKLLTNFKYIKDNVDTIFNVNGNINNKLNVCKKFLVKMKMKMIMMEQHRFNKYTVFESINNRGLSLSEFDKIKNLALHIADQHERRSNVAANHPVITKQIIQTHWYSTINHLHNYELEKCEDQCINDLWKVIYNEGTSKESEVFIKFKEKFQSLVDHDEDDIMLELFTFVNNWAPYTKAYCQIYTKKPGEEFSLANMTANTATNLDRILNRINLDQEFKLPLTSGFLKYTQADFETFSECMEKALFRMHGIPLARSISRGRISFTKLAQNIFSSHQTLNDSISEICRYVTKYAPFGGPDGLVEHFISGKPAYRKWRGYSLYYFLYRVDREISPGAAVGWVTENEGRNEQIEHILPNSHRNHWTPTWPNGDTADKWKHRLGNLTLTRDSASNNQLDTHPIEVKCRTNHPNYTYLHGRHIERRVATVATMFTTSELWGKLQIILHELKYSRDLIKLWSLPCDCDLENFALTEDSKDKIESYFNEMVELHENVIRASFTEKHDSEDLDGDEYEEYKAEYVKKLRLMLDINEITNFSPREISELPGDAEIIPCAVPDEEE
jgi:hypothetical protein